MFLLFDFVKNLFNLRSVNFSHRTPMDRALAFFLNIASAFMQLLKFSQFYNIPETIFFAQRFALFPVQNSIPIFRLIL